MSNITPSDAKQRVESFVRVVDGFFDTLLDIMPSDSGLSKSTDRRAELYTNFLNFMSSIGFLNFKTEEHSWRKMLSYYTSSKQHMNESSNNKYKIILAFYNLQLDPFLTTFQTVLQEAYNMIKTAESLLNCEGEHTVKKQSGTIINMANYTKKQDK